MDIYVFKFLHLKSWHFQIFYLIFYFVVLIFIMNIYKFRMALSIRIFITCVFIIISPALMHVQEQNRSKEQPVMNFFLVSGVYGSLDF